MEDKNVVVTGIFIGFILCFVILLAFTPAGVKLQNEYEALMQKADDESNYDTLKKVEDTCRSMIASYEADLLVYEQYKDSDNEEKQSWAEQAKMRANKTASSYNNYVLKNEHVWKNNVPDDIAEKLEIIK